ncbi:MAG: hypothetical protein LBP52_05720, partial [Burkholderiaceae bacterium]|nr:hypothetical protein [Burkholderiaceae bacterium]
MGEQDAPHSAGLPRRCASRNDGSFWVRAPQKGVMANVVSFKRSASAFYSHWRNANPGAASSLDSAGIQKATLQSGFLLCKPERLMCFAL